MKKKDKKIKISITLCPNINNLMDRELINKSKLIDKLLKEYYANKNLL